MTENYVYEQPPTEMHLTEIGRVAVESAILEQLLRLGIWQLMKTTVEFGEIVTQQLHLEAKSDLFFEIANERFPKDLEELKRIRALIKAVINKRNDYMHGIWDWSIKQNEPFLIRYRKRKNEGIRKVTPTHRKVTPKQIAETAAEICVAQDELIIFLNTHGVSPPQRRSKPSQPD